MPIEDVRRLVAERQRYDDWLMALEAKRAETPIRVFDRVHSDYLGRRLGVMEQLREHVDALAALGDDLETRIGTLEAQLTTHEDERAEALLRTAVGEYDSDRWETVRLDVEASIAQLGEQRAALVAEVDEVRTLLSSARAEPPESAPEEPAITASSADALTATHEKEVLPDDPSVGAPTSADSCDTPPSGAHDVFTATASETRAVDDLAVAPAAIATPEPTADDAWPDASLDEIVATPGASEAPATAPSPGRLFEDVRRDELDGADFDDALALFSSTPRTEDTPSPGAGSALGMLDGLASSTVDDLIAPRTQASGSPSAAPSVANDASAESTRDSFDDLAFLRSVIDPSTQSAGVRASSAGDQQKTLRCTECGTMNFPTEWYCERCGGELAAF